MKIQQILFAVFGTAAMAAPSSSMQTKRENGIIARQYSYNDTGAVCLPFPFVRSCLLMRG